MENVKIADTRVAKIRKSIVHSKGVSTEIKLADLTEYLVSLERLAALERHLYNLTANGYPNV